MIIVGIFALFAIAGVNGWSMPFVNIMESDMGLSSTFFSDYGWLVTTGSIAGVLVILIPLYMIIKRIMGRSFGKHSITILFITWVLMLIWSIFSLIACGTSFQRYINKIETLPDAQAVDSTDVQPASPWQQMEELEDTAAIDLMSE